MNDALIVKVLKCFQNGDAKRRYLFFVKADSTGQNVVKRTAVHKFHENPEFIIPLAAFAATFLVNYESGEHFHNVWVSQVPHGVYLKQKQKPGVIVHTAERSNVKFNTLASGLKDSSPDSS